MFVVFVEVIAAVGESKSALLSADFHWHKFQWGRVYRDYNNIIDNHHSLLRHMRQHKSKTIQKTSTQ